MEENVPSDTAEESEKIGVSKIRLTKPAKGIHAVMGSFSTADNCLMAWCSASKGWLTCKFEVEYLDGYILKGEYRKYRRKSPRLSLSNYIRSALRPVEERARAHPHVIATFENAKIQLWQGRSHSDVDADFLKHHEIGDLAEFSPK